MPYDDFLMCHNIILLVSETQGVFPQYITSREKVNNLVSLTSCRRETSHLGKWRMEVVPNKENVGQIKRPEVFLYIFVTVFEIHLFSYALIPIVQLFIISDLAMNCGHLSNCFLNSYYLIWLSWILK